MFKEQYIRDNDKLKAKETLLMEIKEKNTREKIALTPKQKFVRYGAVFAAFLLVAVSVFGLITANKPGSAAPQNAALSASADAMAASAGAIGQRLGRVALDESAHALRAAAAVTQARTPAQAAEAQFSYAISWWSRAAAQAMTRAPTPAARNVQGASSTR